MDNCLKLFNVLFKLLPVSQTIGTHTSKRKILGNAQIIVFAFPTCKIFAAARAALKKHNLSVKYTSNYVHQLLDVVVTFDGEDSLFSVVFAA